LLEFIKECSRVCKVFAVKTRRNLDDNFAAALGIDGDPLNAEGLPVDPQMFRRDDLLALATGEPVGGFGRQIEALLALAAAGYEIFFLANG